MGITPNYDLDVDTSLGGSSASDYVIPSQKAIKSYVDNNSGTSIPPIAYGTSTTSASIAEKVVSIPAITELNSGQIIVVSPTKSASVADLTIKLNNFSAYPILYAGNAITTSTDNLVWNANQPSAFVFNGSNWLFLCHGLDSNTTYSTMSVLEGVTGTATSNRTLQAANLKQIIQGTTLTDLSIATASTVLATDTITDGIGKLQAQINALPSIPTNISAFTNDSGYLISSDFKTINSTSIIGSGNIDTSEIFVAIYGTTTASQISQALASGKIIFGGKTVSSIDYFYYYSGIIDTAYTFSRVYQNTSEVISISTITNQWNTITKTLANDNLSNVSSIDVNSAVQTALNDKANTTLSNVSNIDSGSAVATALNGKADTDLSNLSASGKTVIDGQWVSAYEEIVSSSGYTISQNTTQTWTLSNLPNDGNCYEVIFTFIAAANTNMALFSPLVDNTNRSGGAGSQGNSVSVIIPLSTDRKISVRNYGTSGKISFFRMCSYRRIGSNS